MNTGHIQLSRVLEQMESLDGTGRPISFHLKFVTADRKRGAGGEIIEIPSGRKCIGRRKEGIVFDTRQDKTAGTESRDPNHWANSTRNILLPNGQIRKIHIRLIIEFNHQKVFF